MSNRHPTASETGLVFVIHHFYTAGHSLPQNNNCAETAQRLTALLKLSCWKERTVQPGSALEDRGIRGTQSKQQLPNVQHHLAE